MNFVELYVMTYTMMLFKYVVSAKVEFFYNFYICGMSLYLQNENEFIRN